MLLLVSLTISSAVWFSTDSQLREQIENDLDVASLVLRNTLNTRESQLIQAAQVLTADFGFKQAVATVDIDTISSVLKNHGERINADLLAILSLDGAVMASSVEVMSAGSRFSEPDLLRQAISADGASSFLVVDGAMFQVILLPVRTPDIIGVAVIGFHINTALVASLREISQLEITFHYKDAAGQIMTLSSLPETRVHQVLENSVSKLGFRLPFVKTDQYLTKTLQLTQNNNPRFQVLISASADAAYRRYDTLKFEVFVISIIGILISLLFGSIFSNNISLPLQRLADAARSIASGNYQHHIDVGKSSQEVHDLNTAFITMQSDLRAREARIVYQSHHDPLTGLLNRQRAMGIIGEILERQPFVVHIAIAINTREFRVINETFGYKVGDEYLRRMATRLQTLAETGLLCARLDSDEFLVFSQGRDKPETILDELAHLLGQVYLIDGLEIRAQYSFATAQFPKDAKTASELLNKTDVALDISRQRKLSVYHYEAGIEEARQQRLQIINDLKIALAANDGQLQMYYQPKVCLHNGLASRFEALIRWIHPTRGFIPPDNFIQLAEQSGLIQSLTDFVVATVIRQLSPWYREGFQCTVAVNLSAQDVARPALLEFILSELAAHQLPRSCLSIEITESDVMSEPEKAMALLQRYRSEGISVAIDDFGTGFSSLSQLKNMPVNELKIDKGFILQLANTPNDQIIVQSTLELAHRFGLEVVAEGVETKESLALLRAWGCEWAQGYYFGKPMKASEIFGWVQAYLQSDKYVVNQQ